MTTAPIERSRAALDSITYPAAGSAASLVVETHGELDEEQLRRRLADALPHVRTSLERVFDSADPELARFFVARIEDRAFRPDRRRVIDFGHALREALELRSVDPLHDAPVAAGEHAGQASCSSSGPPEDCDDGTQPSNAEWPLEILKAEQAWQLVPGMGQGVLIGQPDTGTADHHFLSFGAIDLRPACNLIERGQLPQDPLLNSGNPGHGTSVASVATNRGRVDPGRRRVRGTAPGATVVPVRCVHSVLITDFQVPVLAEAIRTAVDQGCKVVSMSLGGFPVTFAVVEAALRYGAGKGVIFVGAAGNGLAGIRGDAAYPGRSYFCSCIAGTDHRNQGWNRSLGGERYVTVSAPAKCVWSAWRLHGDHSRPDRTWNTGRGSGTSYATALVAGLAALWIAKHGHAELFRRYGERLTKVFHDVLQKSAYVPPGWDRYYGAGVADAARLVALDLPAQALGAASPQDQLRERVNELAASHGGAGSFGATLDDAFLAAYGRELEVHLNHAEAARAGGPTASGRSPGHGLSESLKGALERAGAGALLTVLEPPATLAAAL